MTSFVSLVELYVAGLARPTKVNAIWYDREGGAMTKEQEEAIQEINAQKALFRARREEIYSNHAGKFVGFGGNKLFVDNTLDGVRRKMGTVRGYIREIV